MLATIKASGRDPISFFTDLSATCILSLGTKFHEILGDILTPSEEVAPGPAMEEITSKRPLSRS
jgi:hypothetical protein